jgi:hypothetical protein
LGRHAVRMLLRSLDRPGPTKSVDDASGSSRLVEATLKI